MYTQRKHGDGPSVHGVVVDDNDHGGASRGSSEQFTQMRSITQHTQTSGPPCYAVSQLRIPRLQYRQQGRREGKGTEPPHQPCQQYCVNELRAAEHLALATPANYSIRQWSTWLPPHHKAVKPFRNGLCPASKEGGDVGRGMEQSCTAVTRRQTSFFGQELPSGQ